MNEEEWMNKKKNNKNDEYWSHRALPTMTKQIHNDNIDWTKNWRRNWAWFISIPLILNHILYKSQTNTDNLH